MKKWFFWSFGIPLILILGGEDVSGTELSSCPTHFNWAGTKVDTLKTWRDILQKVNPEMAVPETEAEAVKAMCVDYEQCGKDQIISFIYSESTFSNYAIIDNIDKSAGYHLLLMNASPDQPPTLKVETTEPYLWIRQEIDWNGREEFCDDEDDDNTCYTATVLLSATYNDYAFDRKSGELLWTASCTSDEDAPDRPSELKISDTSITYTSCKKKKETLSFTLKQLETCAETNKTDSVPSTELTPCPVSYLSWKGQKIEKQNDWKGVLQVVEPKKPIPDTNKEAEKIVCNYESECGMAREISFAESDSIFDYFAIIKESGGYYTFPLSEVTPDNSPSLEVLIRSPYLVIRQMVEHTGREEFCEGDDCFTATIAMGNQTVDYAFDPKEGTLLWIANCHSGEDFLGVTPELNITGNVITYKSCKEKPSIIRFTEKRLQNCAGSE